MKLEEQWVEIIVLILLTTGFIIAVLLFSPIYSYITIALAGFLGARVYYVRRHKERILPFILMIVGFLLGYIVGGFWVSRKLVFFIFALSFGISYYLHVKKILVIFKSKKFLK